MENDDYHTCSSDQQVSLEYIIAEIEMLLAAYPNEISCQTIAEHSNNNNHVVMTPSNFPLHVTLHLSSTAHIVLEYTLGYPKTQRSSVAISSYRCNALEKRQLDYTLRFCHKVLSDHNNDDDNSSECNGYTCVVTAFEKWHDYQVKPDHLGKASNDDEHLHNSTVHDVVNNQLPLNSFSTATTSSSTRAIETTKSGEMYRWVTGSPLIVQKSTFVAHVCRINQQSDVQPALYQLLSSTSKLQRATHNMVRYLLLFYLG
jgi:hypothetical protein